MKEWLNNKILWIMYSSYKLEKCNAGFYCTIVYLKTSKIGNFFGFEDVKTHHEDIDDEGFIDLTKFMKRRRL